LREREEITQSIYTGSLLTRATSSPQKTTGYFTKNQSTYYNYTTPQRGDLDHTRTLTLFAFQTNTVRTILWLHSFTNLQVYKMKAIIKSKGTDYTWCLGNHKAPKSLLEPMHNL